ncbi:hypothetical protein F7725_006327 [Dissostichus mawsoni]|uniref:Uncharacterized protein n=1 Tax=Dissostichus mawsoni TaxID=36200 RepID=A0A7J5XTL9_DISMA|nr:hypothetical protein F7725_006327 [Dissostichus mawsoni]
MKLRFHFRFKMSGERVPSRAEVTGWSPQQLAEYLTRMSLSGCDKVVLKNSISGSRFVSEEELDDDYEDPDSGGEGGGAATTSPRWTTITTTTSPPLRAPGGHGAQTGAPPPAGGRGIHRSSGAAADSSCEQTGSSLGTELVPRPHRNTVEKASARRSSGLEQTSSSPPDPDPDLRQPERLLRQTGCHQPTHNEAFLPAFLPAFPLAALCPTNCNLRVDSARGVQGSASKWKGSSVVLVEVSLLVPPGGDSAATGGVILQPPGGILQPPGGDSAATWGALKTAAWSGSTAVCQSFVLHNSPKGQDLDPSWYVGRVTRGRSLPGQRQHSAVGSAAVHSDGFVPAESFNIQIREQAGNFLLGTGLKVKESPLLLIDAKNRGSGQQNQCLLSEPAGPHMGQNQWS